jgi:[lysine-biosynthesis-protein LysW]---L-2-aminoadipate ligase
VLYPPCPGNCSHNRHAALPRCSPTWPARSRTLRPMKFAVIAHQLTETNVALSARGWPGARSHLIPPRKALLELGAGDIALNRLDVSRDLDSVEDGIWSITQLEAQGVRVFNRPPALLSCHDKLLTARLLRRAGVPHPRTRRLERARSADALRYPVVAKPRFGSWGRDVELCTDRAALERYVATMRKRSWWRIGGIVQELVRPLGIDLRVIVAGGNVVGAASRTAAPGEWRTNVAVGGTPNSAVPPPDACELAVAATSALGIDFAGVDLLPDGSSWVVLEVNGAVDVRPMYSLETDVYTAALRSLQTTTEEQLLLA